MQDQEFIKSTVQITEAIHSSLSVGDMVCCRQTWNKGIEILNLGRITKLNKRSLTVDVFDADPKYSKGSLTFTGRYNKFGMLVFPHSRHGFSLGYRNLHVVRAPIGVSQKKAEAEAALRFRTLAEKKQVAAAEDARKHQEERDAAEQARLAKIEAFWEAEGRKIWESRQIHALPLPFEMHVLTRPVTIRTAGDGSQYEVVPKVANCIMTISDDKYDWKAKDEGRQPRQIVEIQVSGFEIRKYDGQDRPSSFSSSSYSFELGSSYQKQFMYDLFGGW